MSSKDGKNLIQDFRKVAYGETYVGPFSRDVEKSEKMSYIYTYSHDVIDEGAGKGSFELLFREETLRYF